jgi:hypothetical protein
MRMRGIQPDYRKTSKQRFFEKKRAKNFCGRAEATPVSL